MASFLVKYSNTPDPTPSAPRQGSVIELHTLEDFDNLMRATGATRLVLHQPGEFEAPWWASSMQTAIWDDDQDTHYTVSMMPEGWQMMRWIEIYNGYRE